MKKTGTKIIVGIMGTLATVAGVSYLAGAWYFKDHYYLHTTVGSVECGAKDSAYAEEGITRIVEDYLLTIYDRQGNKFFIMGPDFTYKYIPRQEEQAILESQNPFGWISCIQNEYNYELETSVSYSEIELEEAVKALGLFDSDYILPPEDAYITITEEGYDLIPEVNGNEPIPGQIYQEIKDAIDLQQTDLILSDACYKKPEILSDDPSITITTDTLDQYLNSTVTYELEGANEVVDGKRIMSFLSIDENGQVTLQEEKVEQYVQYLASTYNTFGDKREFLTSMGDTIEVAGGDYGWVVDKAGEKTQLLADLAGGKPVSRPMVYEQEAKYQGADDIGNTYVEIDYTNQHLWYYVDGNLEMETDVVTGNISKNNGSPDGIYKIVYKQKDATLVGENYTTPVKYFMPFAYNVGIHDAGWRSSFGGTIYKNSGSHGCINVPPDFAEALYEVIEIGTPVITYYRDPVVLTAENARISNARSYVDPSTLAPVKTEEEQKEDGDNSETSDNKKDKKDKNKKNKKDKNKKKNP